MRPRRIENAAAHSAATAQRLIGRRIVLAVKVAAEHGGADDPGPDNVAAEAAEDIGAFQIVIVGRVVDVLRVLNLQASVAVGLENDGLIVRRSEEVTGGIRAGIAAEQPREGICHARRKFVCGNRSRCDFGVCNRSVRHGVRFDGVGVADDLLARRKRGIAVDLNLQVNGAVDYDIRQRVSAAKQDGEGNRCALFTALIVCVQRRCAAVAAVGSSQMLNVTLYTLLAVESGRGVPSGLARRP